MSDFTKGLNESQKQAVLHNEGPLLVFAGAGSGKTRVLTMRVARLVKEKVCTPSQILAVTFTNKAAREMQERLAALAGVKASAAMTVSTFHSLGAKILREDGEVIGLKPHFSILDENERHSTLKKIMRSYAPANAQDGFDIFANQVSLLKNASFDPNTGAKDSLVSPRDCRMYKAYQETLLHRQSVDFDDLLLLPLRIFERSPDALKKYQQRYHFVCVDEYQDTNTVQMKLAGLLAAPQNNLMVVGDDDQSIYSWRGANFENILHFAPAFKGCKTVVLDKNYRSTRQILMGAYAVVEKNSKRKQKKISAVAGDGEPIQHYRGDDEEDEALHVAETIRSHIANQEFHFNDHALLFRTNAMMQRFELSLRQCKVPYRVVGGMSFFDRREVRDVMAYLRFFANPADEVSLSRVLKVPDKGIAKSSLESLEQLAGLRKIGLTDALEVHEAAEGLTEAQHQKCAEFNQYCIKQRAALTSGNLAVTLRAMLTEAGYFAHLERAYKESGDHQERLALVEEIIHGLETYEHKNAKRHPTLAGYIQDLTLALTEEDEAQDGKNQVQFMTVHKSKGLEFPCVFLVGLDDAIFPSSRAIEEGGIEEERRLFYVAMTRAKRRLILTYPKIKVFRKKELPVNPCRFMLDIPEEFLERPLGKKEDADYDTFVGDFFKGMREKLVVPADLVGATLERPAVARQAVMAPTTIGHMPVEPTQESPTASPTPGNG